jgi:peptide methionine sulfoxide reductase MsrB
MHISQLDNAAYCVLLQDGTEKSMNCKFYTAYGKFVFCVVVNSKYLSECND